MEKEELVGVKTVTEQKFVEISSNPPFSAVPLVGLGLFVYYYHFDPLFFYRSYIVYSLSIFFPVLKGKGIGLGGLTVTSLWSS